MQRDGLGILYATPHGDREHDSVSDHDHDLTNHLRERYWEGRVDDRRSKAGSKWLSGGFHVDLGRSGVGRLRHQSGDAFLYSVSFDLSGTHTHTEWYEVTEAFLIVEARDVTAFMRCVNGLPTDNRFDPAAFLRSVDRRRLGRAQQPATPHGCQPGTKIPNLANPARLWQHHSASNALATSEARPSSRFSQAA